VNFQRKNFEECPIFHIPIVRLSTEITNISITFFDISIIYILYVRVSSPFPVYFSLFLFAPFLLCHPSPKTSYLNICKRKRLFREDIEQLKLSRKFVFSYFHDSLQINNIQYHLIFCQVL
jgi:hypothetical protein